ncbi:MAG TPA: D-2-hydroxyacid dehydrogenase [Polyangiaceae bacterium]|jgi:glycerate dehydrogenase|nr:D-2-hydroxyacid dehydrogenase [Polyangiaceae bacterium]
MKIVVLDGFAADQGDAAVWAPLEALGNVEVHPRTAPSELLSRAHGADALLTNKVLLDATTLSRLDALRYVGIVATGTNAVDLTTCRTRGVAVTNVPGYSTHSVAQLVFALLFHLTHDVAAHDSRVKEGGWASSPDFVFCLQPLTELAGKTLGVVGMGAIGRTVAGIATALGMKVVAAAVPGSQSEGRTPLVDALGQSDFVTLHCPLTPATHHLVNDAFLGAMKRTAVLVNTGRGALVDEGALARALDAGTIHGAALDVVEREPPLAGHPLLDPAAPFARRIVVTPHIGWATVEARARLVATVIDNLAAFTRSERVNRVELEAAPQTLSLAPPKG